MRKIRMESLCALGLTLTALSPSLLADGIILVPKPSAVDVIFSADNSGSMNAETLAMISEMPTFFANLTGAGIDAQLIAVTRFGDSSLESYCFPPPIGAAPCVGGSPAETPTFKHYSVEIGSHNMWCLLQDTYDVADEFSLHPTGWSDSLRAEAFKVFIFLSDDGVICTNLATTSYDDNDIVLDGESSAMQFDTDLLALDPAQFGTSLDRRYVVHSMVGMDGAGAGMILAPTDPIDTFLCFSAVDPGTGHQAISRITGGLRYPLCDLPGYGLFLNAVVSDAVARVGSGGQYDIPGGIPAGVDPATLLIELDPNDGGPLVILQQDAGCTGLTFTVSGSTVSLCPDAQTLVSAYTNPILNLLYASADSPVWCNGDGGNQFGCTNCPCMNNAPVGTIGGCLNSAGTSARLISCGDTSVSLPSGSSTDLRFSLVGAPGSAFCILNSGAAIAPANAMNPCFGLGSGTQSVSFDGLRCAVQSTRRHGGRSADTDGQVGITNNPWGGEAAPPAGLAVAFGGFSAGSLRFFQVIHREDSDLSCMRGLNTSQAIEITFTP